MRKKRNREKQTSTKISEADTAKEGLKKERKGASQGPPLRRMHHRPGGCVAVDFLETVQHAESHRGETVKVAVTIDLNETNG